LDKAPTKALQSYNLQGIEEQMKKLSDSGLIPGKSSVYIAPFQ
jgi:hypothetical protein